MQVSSLQPDSLGWDFNSPAAIGKAQQKKIYKFKKNKLVF